MTRSGCSGRPPRPTKRYSKRQPQMRIALGWAPHWWLLWPEREAVILNEGDSRAYHINGDGIVLITRDHSLVEDLVERGELTREQARTHPHKNLITRALGAEPVLLADCFRQPLAQGDFLLLCSDGLSNLVTEQEMLYEVIHGGDSESCPQRLLDIALHRGAPDNVTAVLIRC